MLDFNQLGARSIPAGSDQPVAAHDERGSNVRMAAGPRVLPEFFAVQVPSNNGAGENHNLTAAEEGTLQRRTVVRAAGPFGPQQGSVRGRIGDQGSIWSAPNARYDLAVRDQ